MSTARYWCYQKARIGHITSHAKFLTFVNAATVTPNHETMWWYTFSDAAFELQNTITSLHSEKVPKSCREFSAWMSLFTTTWHIVWVYYILWCRDYFTFSKRKRRWFLSQMPGRSIPSAGEDWCWDAASALFLGFPLFKQYYLHYDTRRHYTLCRHYRSIKIFLI